MSTEDSQTPAKLIAWVEANTGGRVCSCVRQGRWRPAWFIDVKLSDGILKLYARGDRPADLAPAYPLEYEIQIHNLFEREGIPVPHVIGFCEDPRYMVMQCVGGRANLGTAVDDGERLAVMKEYITALAHVHQIPLKAIEAAGFPIPVGREAIALDNFAIYEREFQRIKMRPDPFAEFGRRWVRRHLPAQDRPAAFTVYDAGQFHFENGHLVALLDLELGHVGDPFADLAALPMRDTVEPLGDLAPIFQQYARLTGTVIDPAIIAFHTIKWAMVTPLCLHQALTAPKPETDLVTYLTWYVDNGRWATEGMAEMAGFDLDPISIPDSSFGPRRVIFDHMAAVIDAEEPRDDLARHNHRRLHRLHRHLRRSDEIGAEFLSADLEETGQLLGIKVTSMQEADERLERFVIAAPPSRDAELVRLFDRRLQRQQALLGRPDSRIVVHPPIQKIGRMAP